MATIIFSLILLTLTVCASQDNPQVTFTLREEQVSGTEVGDLTTIELNATESEKSNMRYFFLSNDYNGLFSLKDSTGKLFTIVAIDREYVCEYLKDCIIEFKVAANSGPFFQEINVKVVIEDINDNKPVFPEATVDLAISEGVTINSSYIIRSAMDKDTGGNNGNLTYEINPPSDTFSLISEKKLDGNRNVKIYVTKQLDRETQSSHQIRILAKDGGDPVQTGSVDVNIIVTDVNDHTPVFKKTLYNVTIEEDMEPTTVILTLSATDEDSGRNAEISYRISEHQPGADRILHTFMVDSGTGELKLKNPLVYQEGEFYKFIVEALDNGEQPEVSQAEVLVYVKDSKNNAPIIKISFLSPGNIGFANISENSPVGTLVAYVNVEDTDSGLNGNVSCSISDNQLSIQRTSTGTYIVKVKSKLDREVEDLHNVTVFCQDKGTPPMEASDSFLVRVTDYNDNNPVFKSLNYVASIYENEVVERLVLEVSATDKDIGKNKAIHYAIRNHEKIKIDSNTGLISVLPSFDRELTPTVVFDVLAIDEGDQPLTGTATVTLTVKDQNDNAPKFIKDNYKFDITENLNSGFSIGQLSADDLDIDENGRFIFSLSPEYVETKLPFTIFSNGVIKSNRELDREVQSRYNFYAIVTDQGDPKLSSSSHVVVDVNDVNDNAPNITFPGRTNRTVSLLYPVAEKNLHSPVTRIEAYDIDQGENRTLRYSIVQGGDLGIFSLDEESGLINVKDNSVEIENDMRVTLSIEVHDMGVERRSSREDLHLELIYSNATFVDTDASDNKYIVISAVVVVVTVLISAIIIFTIFLLRNLDKKRRRLSEPLQADSDCGFENKPSMFIINTTSESSTDSASTSTENGKKKKEVSFSLDDQDSLSHFSPELRVSNFPEPYKKPPEKVYFVYTL